MTIQCEAPNHQQQHQEPIHIKFMGDIHAKGFTVASDDVDIDGYLVLGPDETPRLMLVGIPDADHGWIVWKGYEVFGLVQEDEQDEVIDPKSVPFDTSVRLAVNRLVSDLGLRVRSDEKEDADNPDPSFAAMLDILDVLEKQGFSRRDDIEGVLGRLLRGLGPKPPSPASPSEKGTP